MPTSRSLIGRVAYRVGMTILAVMLGLVTFYGATFVHSAWILPTIPDFVK
jgi:hypothetical protein